MNFDVSPTLRLSKLPLIKRLLRLPDWPTNAHYGDITKGLPLANASCSRLYCDQVLEHLSRDDVFKALQECRRLLASDGVFRLFVPELRTIASSYLHMNTGASAEWFMATTGLGLTRRPRSAFQHLREWMGNSRHLWAWDADSMSQALRDAGFTQVRQVQYRDSGDRVFDELEAPIEWQLALGMEARG